MIRIASTPSKPSFHIRRPKGTGFGHILFEIDRGDRGHRGKSISLTLGRSASDCGIAKRTSVDLGHACPRGTWGSVSNAGAAGSWNPSHFFNWALYRNSVGNDSSRADWNAGWADAFGGFHWGIDDFVVFGLGLLYFSLWIWVCRISEISQWRNVLLIDICIYMYIYRILFEHI